MLLIICFLIFFPSSMITIIRNHFLPTFMWQLPPIVTQPEANQKTKNNPNLHPKKIVRLHKLRVSRALQKTLPKKTSSHNFGIFRYIRTCWFCHHELFRTGLYFYFIQACKKTVFFHGELSIEKK